MTRSVTYWPGCAGGSSPPAGSSRPAEVTQAPSPPMAAAAGGREPAAAGGIFEPDRDHRVALPLDGGDRGGTEACVGRRWAGLREAGVAPSGLQVEQVPEGGLPAGAEGRDPECAEQLLTRMSRKIEQRI